MTNDQKNAYLAGFFDGEGCILLAKYKGRLGSRYRLRINASQLEPEPLMMIQESFQCGGITRWLNNYGNVQHQWTASGDNASRVLKELLPFLTVKKEQAVLAIEFQEKSWRKHIMKTEEQAAIDSTIAEQVGFLKKVRQKTL